MVDRCEIKEMVKEKMIKGLIFDMDGTIADTEHIHFLAWEQTLRERGVNSFTFEAFVSYVGVSNEALAHDYIVSHKLKESIEVLCNRKQRIYLDLIPQVQLLPGVEQIVRKYSERCQLGVASSSDCIELELILQNAGLRNYFEVIVGGDMVQNKKPDPEIYLQAARRLGLQPQECCAFEDSEAGVQAASRAGLFVVAVPHSLTLQHDFGHADLIFDSMDQVILPT